MNDVAQPSLVILKINDFFYIAFAGIKNQACSSIKLNLVNGMTSRDINKLRGKYKLY